MLYYNHGKGRKQKPDPIYSQRERKIPNTRKDKKREAYDGSEFRDIVRDVAEELADDLGIEVDEG